MLFVADGQKDKRRRTTKDGKALFGVEKLNIPRSSVPAITRVDYSARIQTVHSDTNPRYRAVIEKFKEKPGCGLVINTSSNVCGEPIDFTPNSEVKFLTGNG